MSGLVPMLTVVLFGGLWIFGELRNEKFSIWLLLCVILIVFPIGYINRHFFDLPSILVRLSYFGVLVVAILALLDKPKTLTTIPRLFLLAYTLLLTVSVFSSLSNSTPIVDIFYSHRGFLVLFAFIIVLSRFREVVRLEGIMKLIVYLGCLNATVAIMQRLLFVSILKLGSGDLVSGVFNSDGEFLFFQLVVLIVVMAYWFHGYQVTRISNAYVVAFVLASLALGNNKASWGFVGLVFLVLGYQVGMRLFFKNFGKVIWIGLLGVMSYSVFDTVYENFYQKKHESELGLAGYVANPEFIQYYLFGNQEADSRFSKSGALKRGAAVSFAFDHIKQSDLTLLFGMGSGSTTSKAFSGVDGYFEFRYPGYKVGRTSLSLMLAEYGLFGVTSLVLFAVFIYLNSGGVKPDVMRLVERTVGVLMISYFAYEPLIEEASHMFIMAVMLMGDTLKSRIYT